MRELLISDPPQGLDFFMLGNRPQTQASRTQEQGWVISFCGSLGAQEML